jgi:hypothetical protein
MNLTEDEKFMVYRLRQKQRTWVGLRWAMLAVGLFEGYLTIRLMRTVLNAQRLNESERTFVPLVIEAGIFVSLFFIVYPIKNWQANPVLTVLLKLVDHCSQGDHPKN